jgi:ATP-dependent protease ClpP protease subunit
MLTEADYLTKWLDYDIDLKTNTMYLGSNDYNKDGEETGTDFKMAKSVIKNLHILKEKDYTIRIIMNNLGGDIYHALAIYDAIQLLTHNEVRITCYGYCMSAGSIILQAADIRAMAPNAVMMLHYGTYAYEGHTPTGISATEETKRLDKWMENLYLSVINNVKPKFTKRKLRELLTNDWYLPAYMAEEYGLIDKVM